VEPLSFFFEKGRLVRKKISEERGALETCTGALEAGKNNGFYQDPLHE
jgi:hypothetical protein